MRTTSARHPLRVRGPTRRRAVWPLEGSEFPPSSFRTFPADARCGRVRLLPRGAPHEPPYGLPKDEDDRGREVDALRTLALRMRERPREEWPDLLLLLGDQVYADEVSPGPRPFAEPRRDTEEPPGERVAGLRGVHAALPGVLVRAGHPLAALHRALGA